MHAKGQLAAYGLAGAIVATFVLTGQYAPEAHPELFNRFGIIPAL